MTSKMTKNPHSYMSIKKIIIKNQKYFGFVIDIRDKAIYSRAKRETLENLKNISLKEKKVFYFGAPNHNNLGDLAQGVCIREWIQNNYQDRKIIEIQSDAVVNYRTAIINKVKSVINDNDIIVFQSGYTTTDLGGNADIMHQIVIEEFKLNPTLMMPQTIFFKDITREKRCSDIYNSHQKMLFLARDEISFEKANKMFPNVSVRLFPDIVTTLIGTRKYTHNRDGIMLCLRNDSEKYYSEQELLELKEKLSLLGEVHQSDTTKPYNRKEMARNPSKFIDKEIDCFAHYKVVITDRYHGTIFSLIAGTPVIVIKTNDHKVISGAAWFKGIYDDYVYVADNLDIAFEFAKSIYNNDNRKLIKPYFKEKYYDKLKFQFEEAIK